ncbi:MAG: AI-2E family transporter [Planctomycetota bacterium]
MTADPESSGTPDPSKSDARHQESALASLADRHLWEIQPVRDVLLIALLLLVIAIGRIASVVTVPVLLAMLLAYLFEPVVCKLAALKWLSRQRAVASIIVLFLALVVVPAVAGAALGVLQVKSLTGLVYERTGGVIESVESPDDEAALAAIPEEGPWRWMRDHLLDLRTEAAAGDLEFAVQWVRANAQAIGEGLLRTGGGAIDALLGLLGGAVTLGGTLFFTLFFFYFVSSRWPAVKSFLSKLIPDERRERVLDLAGKMDAVVSGFVRGRLTIAFLLGVFWAIGFTLIGVPAAIPLGFVTGVLAIAPYAAIVGVPVAIVLLWVEGHTGLRGNIWWVIVAPIVVYNAGQLLDDYVLTPRIQGKETDMDIPTILFATLAGGALLGFFGLLLAIPVAACLKILIKELFWPRFRRWAAGEDPDFLPLSRRS